MEKCDWEDTQKQPVITTNLMRWLLVNTDHFKSYSIPYE